MCAKKIHKLKKGCKRIKREEKEKRKEDGVSVIG
jgi:hypothetical protein